MYKDITIYSDSDHAGCLVTRRSTTGTVVLMGKHCVKASSGLQSTIALSSGESEFYGIVKAASIGLQLQALLADWGYKVNVAVLTDSSAARGTCSRRGLGKLRHVQTRYLWVQEGLARSEITVDQVGTKNNIADMCTKPVNGDSLVKFMKMSGHHFLSGRAATAKHLVKV